MRALFAAGYGNGVRQDTQAGLEKIQAGNDPDDIAHNLVFHAGAREPPVPTVTMPQESRFIGERPATRHSPEVSAAGGAARRRGPP